jgi:hypothetical protein
MRCVSAPAQKSPPSLLSSPHTSHRFRYNGSHRAPSPRTLHRVLFRPPLRSLNRRRSPHHQSIVPRARQFSPLVHLAHLVHPFLFSNLHYSQTHSIVLMFPLSNRSSDDIRPFHRYHVIDPSLDESPHLTPHVRSPVFHSTHVFHQSPSLSFLVYFSRSPRYHPSSPSCLMSIQCTSISLIPQMQYPVYADESVPVSQRAMDCTSSTTACL